MLRKSATPKLGRPPLRPWRRAPRRRWARRDDPGAVATLMEMIPSMPRPALARLTDCLIDRMDELDGDPDLEDDRDEC